jgi:hypothetical protein
MTLTEIHRSLMGFLFEEEVSRLLRHHPLIRERIEAEPPYHFLKGRRSSIEARREAARGPRLLAREGSPSISCAARLRAHGGVLRGDRPRELPRRDVDLFVVTARERPGRWPFCYSWR